MNAIDGTAGELLFIEPARVGDLPIIKPMVDAAYSKYVERIGQPPAPMSANCDSLINNGGMFVFHICSSILGSI